MKYINKKQEPDSLKEYRSTPNSNFNDCNKEDIRNSLLEEQGYICAYCMQRIDNKWNVRLRKFNAEIEHYKSQDVYNGKSGKPDLRLNYNNMLAVCNGNAGLPKHRQHCDKSKDFPENKKYLPLTINPLEKNCESLVRFFGSGIISAKDKIIDRDINVVLNLNEKGLVKERKKAIDIAIQSINRTSKKNNNQSWSLSAIKSEKKKWATLYNSKYRPFCQAVINYLDRKIKKYE